MKTWLQETLSTFAEGLTSAVVLTNLSPTERLFIINFIGAITIRIVWYFTEKKLMHWRYKLTRGYGEKEPPDDYARNSTKRKK
jgi:hypothetical protein